MDLAGRALDRPRRRARRPERAGHTHPGAVSPRVGAWTLLPLVLGCGTTASPPDATVPRDAAGDLAPGDATVTDVAPTPGGCAEVPGPFAPLSTRCGHFVDAQGRVVILHGINARVDGVFDVTLDRERTPVEPVPAFALADAQRM